MGDCFERHCPPTIVRSITVNDPYGVLGGSPILSFRTSLFAVWSLVLASPVFGALTIVGNGTNVTVDAGGAYSITVPDVGWKFSGNVGTPLANLQIQTGADSLGGYSEISFEFHLGVDRRASIRTY